MLSSTSPTLSTPPSPAFHLRRSPYHAPRRPSTSSCASPRPSQLTNPSPRRPDAHHHHHHHQPHHQPPPPQQPQPAAPQHSPVPAFARSPHARRRRYCDSSTQYSPDGYPPTYRPAPPQPAAPATSLSPPPHPPSSIPVERGETSAAASVTEPPEPTLRTTPQTALPAHGAQPNTRLSRDADQEPQRILQTPRQHDTAALSSDQSSPAKRARPQSSSLKVMPLKYETCDVKELGILVSDMLMELVRLNDDMPLRDGQLTRFHSRAPPAISVKDYLFRLIVHATLSPPILLSMVFYVDKLCSMYPAFTISSLTVHRFLITAATVAAKGLSDSFWTNSLYAKVGGVSVRELALLELEFLRKLDWRIVPKPEVLVDYYRGLVERGEGYIMEREVDPEASITPAASAPSSAPSIGDSSSSS